MLISGSELSILNALMAIKVALEDQGLFSIVGYYRWHSVLPHSVNG